MMVILLVQMVVIVVVKHSLDTPVQLQEVLVYKHVEIMFWIVDSNVMMVIVLLEMVVALVAK